MLGLDNFSLSLLQIESLVSTAGKKTHKANFSEIIQLIEQYKPISERHFIRCLFSYIDFSPYEPKSVQKDFHQVQYLSQEFNSLLARLNFPSLFCYAIDKPLPSVKGFSPSRHLLSQISRVLKLSRVQEVALGLALTHSSNSQVVYYAQQWIRQKLPELIRSHVNESETCDSSKTDSETSPNDLVAKNSESRTGGVLHEVSIEILHFILGHLLEEPEHYGISEEMLRNLLTAFRRDFPRSHVPVVLSALLYPDVVELGPTKKALGRETHLTYFVTPSLDSCPTVTTLLNRIQDVTTESVAVNTIEDGGGGGCVDSLFIADLLGELGYVCTRSLDTMRLTLAEFGQREITPVTVAKCLCLFMRTADGQLRSHSSGDGSESGATTQDESDLMMLRVGGSEALWREASTTGTASAKSNRPVSLIMPHNALNRPMTSSSSEPQLSDLNEASSLVQEPICDAWNLEHFLTVVLELNPNISFSQVIPELDCPEFFVPTRAAFCLLKQFLLRGTHQPQLPVNLFYQPWTNAYGHLSLLGACHAYPDVICLAYWPYRCVDLSPYRLNPADEQTHIQIWKNVDYVQALLSLAERGLFSDVYSLLRQAFKACPDIFTATLFETLPNTARSTMLNHVFVYYLSPRSNSQVILQTAWNGCKKNHLSNADLQQQRLLLLAATLECTAQLTSGTLEPTTLPDAAEHSTSAMQSNLTRVVELLAGVFDSMPNSPSRGVALLSILLGTTESPSAAVSVLLPCAGMGAPSSANSLAVPRHLLPCTSQAIDLALVLLVRIANAVTQAANRPETSASVVSVQKAIRVFLPQWFTEYMCDKEVAESFAYGVIDYLRIRYGSYVLGSAASSPSRPASLIAALPSELRKPSPALLTRIIQSAQAALKSSTCCLHKSTLNEVDQTLNLYLQTLSASTGIPAISGNSSQGIRVGSSAFGSTMKPSGGAQSQSQLQSRNTVSSSGNLHSYQTSELASAFSAANNLGTNTDENFSRSSNLNSFASRLNPAGMMQQHSSMANARKTSDGTLGHGLSYSLDHQPVALSFANEPIKIELSKEAETEAYGFFQKLLIGSSTPDEMFKTVCEYATQGNLAQRNLLDGILRMLADEVSQYLPDYPEPMLPLIADLYGSILAASTQLLSIQALSMLWRALLTRIHSLTPETADTPLFRAVILILLKAKNTFTQFFNLPSCFVSCPVFKLFPHELQEYILNAELIANNYIRSQQTGCSSSKTTTANAFHHQQQQQGAAPGSASNQHGQQQSQVSGLTFYSNHSEPAFKPPDPPEESVTDRIYFLFNNVSQTNVKEKSAELVELLSEERVLPWFAYYLVGKRVPVEHTFHDLFALVLDHVQERITSIRPKVMQELMRNIKLLLRNMRKDRDDMQARTTLKNLGNFLGLITLARNKPLLHDDLNVKDLVYEAYHKGSGPAQYVVPFVARVIQSAKNSIVFRPPNPWTMAILKVFRELYGLNDVKDCLRFEIEILYNTFTLSVEDVPMAYFLRDRSHASNLEIQLCFFVPTEPQSLALTGTSSASAADTSAVAATTSTTSSTASEVIPSSISSTMPSQQQQQMLNIIAALQKQQQQQQQLQQTSGHHTQSATTPTSNLDVSSGVDLASIMQSSTGVSGTTRALVLAALAAQKQLQSGQQFGTPGTTTTSGTAGNAASASFSMQQKQLATMAALQQLQQTPSATAPYSTSGLPLQPSSVSISDSAVEVPGGNLRYDEVSVRTIRACLNPDDLIATAAAASSRSTGGGTTASNSATQAAIALLQSNPRLRGLIEPAITRAINELTTPVFERCARITVTTVAAIVRKDFALDPDPNRMLYAARHMVRHLAAGMSLITAREALGMSLVTGLKNIMLAEVQSASGQEKEAVQRLAHLVVARSMHTCLAFMQKSVAEKAVNDVERKLEADLKLRTELGPQRFLEQATSQLAAQQASMPDSLKLTVGGLTPSELSVYEEFGRVIPGFAQSSSMSAPPNSSSLGVSSMGGQPSAAAAAYLRMSTTQQQSQSDFAANRLQRQIAATAGPVGVSLLKPLMSQAQLGGPTTSQQQQQLMLLQQQQQQQQQQAPITGLLDKIIAQIERHLAFISSRLCSTTDPMIRSLRCLIDAVHLAKSNRDSNVAVAVIATMVQSFLEHYRPSVWRDQPRGLETMEHLKEAHMLTLRHMLSSDQASFGYAWVTRQVTQTWIHLDGGNVSKEHSGPPSSTTQAAESTAVDGTIDAGHETTTAAAAASNSEEKQISNEATGETGDTSKWSGWKSSQSDATRTDVSVSDNRLNAIKWNWEAFAELLKVHVIYLSQVDTYLAQEVSAGHTGAITFVIDLLDHFVLPCPTGTAVGAAAAAAASYARSSANAATQGQTSQSGSNVSSTAVSYPTASTTSGPQPPIQPSKREFTVLNEYDLWTTLEAMRTRVTCLGASSTTSRAAPLALVDPLGLRLRLACARVRGLLDLGLMEQSPLFITPTPPSPIMVLYSGCSQAREFDDPPNLQEKVELLMRNWFEIYQSPRQRDPTTIEAMLAQLNQIGVLPHMDNLTRFLRLATIFVIERALKQLKLQDQQPSSQQQQQQQQQQQNQTLGMPPGGGGSNNVPLSNLTGGNLNSNMAMTRVAAYIELDAYARLISIIIKRSGDQPDQPNIRVLLLNKVLGIIAGTLLQEHEVRRDLFHPMPFERILIMLFVEFHSAASFPTNDVVDENTNQPLANTEIVATDKSARSVSSLGKLAMPNLSLQQQLPLIFCHLLHCLRPEKATAFVFSWLEMLAHRWFVGRILAAPTSPELRAAYQAMYAQLLVDLLKFLGYFLQNALMPKPIQCLYKATLRLFLVLIHDFPEFVSDYYALFCDVVPSNSIQMRNLILSALPKRGIPSADPLQAPPVDNLASLEDPTGYCMEAGSRLPEPMHRELDAYLSSRAPVKLLSELVTMLRRADDILPPLPPPQFAYHPQQQACHQQALAAYAAALVANDTGTTISIPVATAKSEEKPSSEDNGNSGSSKKPSGGDATESSESTFNALDTNEQAAATTNLRSASVGGSGSTTPLLWGVRATQQLATFGLADGMHYNVELMTNLTLYVCITALRSLREKGMPLNMSTIAHTPQMDIIQSLVLNLDNEGRYLLLNCMANQLRYPNSHTYYFSYTILYLFSEQSKEQVKEQISRVLMERLIVNRPHPWGLLMTSAELLRNPAYRFWEHEFARCNPEIETIVTLVARSCIPNFQIPTAASGTGASGLRNALTSSSTTADRRRQASPLARGSPAVTDGATGGNANPMRISRALNSFIPG